MVVEGSKGVEVGVERIVADGEKGGVLLVNRNSCCWPWIALSKWGRKCLVVVVVAFGTVNSVNVVVVVVVVGLSVCIDLMVLVWLTPLFSIATVAAAEVPAIVGVAVIASSPIAVVVIVVGFVVSGCDVSTVAVVAISLSKYSKL